MITKSDMARLAAMAKIALSGDELESLTADLEKILNSVAPLTKLDTSNIKPTYQITNLKNVWRDDEIQPQIPREKLLALAPESKNNQVKVPKVL